MDLLRLMNMIPGAVSQGLLWGLMAIGVFLTYRVLDMADLTVDGSIATGGVVAAVLIANGLDPLLSLVVAFLAGMVCGAITGFFHTSMGIPAILAGILTQLGLYSINLRIMSDKSNMGLNVSKTPLLISLRNVKQLDFSNPIFLLLLFTVLLIALLYLFFGTEYGASMRATGSNEMMARAQGIHTKRIKVIGLMLSNGIVAMAGALLTQYQGFADIQMGRGAIVIGLASVIIGRVVFGKIFRNFALRLLSVSLGAVIYYLVMQVVLWIGLNTNDLKLITALIVALFLGIPHWQANMAISHRKEGVPHA